MSNPSTMVAAERLPRTKSQKFWIAFKKNWQLHLMILLPLIYLVLFSYVPMYGLQIAFKDYSPKKGYWDSPWVGLKHFKAFFEYYRWPQLVENTLAISLYSILVGFPIPVILALMIHINTGKALKKVAQNISYIPHFISLVVIIGMINTILNPVSGLLGTIYRWFGVIGADDIRSDADTFRHLYVWSDIWQSAGWSSIIFLSALSSVPDELHEAAKLDGASRLRRVWSVDLPTILPTVALMLIMRFGSIMSVGYQKAYLLQNDANLTTAEIISTYVYKEGLAANNMSFGTAVDILNAFINTSMVFLVNAITNALSDNELGLF